MKAYLITTCVVFGLVFAAHLWRILEEGARLAREPGFIVLTLAAAALCCWAGYLLKLRQRS